MKTAIFRFFSFCFALLLLAACSRDGQPFLPDDTGKDDGDIPVDIVVSRSTFTGAGDGGETDTKFTPGCHIGVSVDGSAAYQNVRYKYPASGSTLVAVDKKIYCGEHSASKVKAYYPYQDDGAYSTAFVEATLAQLYKEKDPLYGGWRGGPAYYLHALAERRRSKKLRHSVTAALFAVSGLICWCGISQVISNSVSSAFQNAFHIPPLTTTLVLTALAALIVLRKNATVKSLDVMVPIMAVCYFVLTVGILVVNFRQLPAVLGRIFAEAFGLRQMAAGGFGAVLMNGVKRGLFSNEAGSGSAPCAAAAAACDDPVKMGFVQALGVLIDTVVICSCTAFLMLLVPQDLTAGLSGMDLLQTAMQYHLGGFGTVFIAATLALFSFSTFLGVLYYARSNVAYLCGDNWWSQTVYKLIALVMLLIGGLQAYTVVWDLGDVGIGLMTIFNMIALYPLSGEVMDALNDYEKRKKLQ